MANTTEVSAEAQEPDTELKRVLSPKLLLLFIVGDILGAGIYAVTGDIADKWAEWPGCRSSSRSPSPL